MLFRPPACHLQCVPTACGSIPFQSQGHFGHERGKAESLSVRDTAAAQLHWNIIKGHRICICASKRKDAASFRKVNVRRGVCKVANSIYAYIYIYKRRGFLPPAHWSWFRRGDAQAWLSLEDDGMQRRSTGMLASIPLGCHSRRNDVRDKGQVCRAESVQCIQVLLFALEPFGVSTGRASSRRFHLMQLVQLRCSTLQLRAGRVA